jgi:hypothetical protein
MNQARKIAVPNSNPLSVLQSIGATTVAEFQSENLVTKTNQFSAATDNSFAPVVSQNSIESELTAPKKVLLRINPDTHPQEAEDIMQSTIESALQVQQLAARLQANESSLLVRETELSDKIEAWEAQVQTQQAEFENRLSQLKQSASQVRCQQLHLMQLQTDIVKSYDAAKQAIELLVSENGSDVETISTLKKLKYEISGRFDYISRRWAHLAKLMQGQRDEQIASHAIDDSIDWTA